MHQFPKRLLATSSIFALLLSNSALAADHYILDGTSKDYKFAIDGSDHLEIVESGGGGLGLTIQHTTGNVITDATLTSTGDFDVNSNFTVTASSGNVLANGTIQTGADGTDGALIIFSEGTTDYTYTIQPHATTTQNVVLTLPADDGTPNQVLETDGSGALSWVDADAADNLGDHTATTDLVMGTNDITGTTGNIDYDNFDVLGASGNTTIGGTLDVTGVTTLATNASITDGTLSVTEDSATTAAVVDVASINASSSGTVAANFGVGVTFDAEDLGGIEEQGSIDLVLTDVTDSSEDSEFVFSVQEAGAITPELTVSGNGIELASGVAVNTILDEDDLNSDSATALATQQSIKAYVDANGADNLGDHTATQDLDLATNDLIGTTAGVNFDHFDVVGSNGNTTVGGTLTVDETASVTGDFDVNTSSFTVNATSGNTAVGGTLTAAGNTTVTDGTLSVTEDSATTNAVVDVASINASSSGTVAANFGVGVTFDAEDLGGVEEQGSIDLVFTDVTDATEDTQFEFSVQEAGAITKELTISGAGITLGTGATVDTIETTLSAAEDTHIPTSKAVADYVGGEISSNSVFEAGDTGTSSIQANNGSADGNGDYSLAAGSGTTNGNYSFAYGFGTTAAGADSTAGGNATTATGNGSVAIGIDGEAKSYGEVVLGLFADGAGYTATSTTAHNTADRLFVLGNGTGSGARANALVIGKDGDADANGDWNFDGISLAGGTVMTSILDEDDMNSDSATALATQQSIKAYVDSNGADNLGDHTATTDLVMGSNNITGTTGNIDLSNFDVVGSSGDTTVGGTLTVSGASATVSDGTLSVTEDSATTAAVVDVASINASSSGTVAANFGVGVTFDAEDLGGIEEQGSIDLVFTDVTDATEDTQFEFSIQEAGVITKELTISGGGITLASGSTVNNILDEDDLNSDSDTALATQQSIKAYVDAEVGGISANTLNGAYDEGGAGAGKTIDVDAGAVEFVGTNASLPTIDVSRSNSAQTGVYDVALFEVSSSGGAGTNNIGAGMSFHVEDASNIEEQASMDVVVTDVTNDAEESEFRFSVQSAGAITQIANIDSGGFDVTGNITATGTITSSSDASLKTNIQGIDNALGSISQIAGVRFDWVGDTPTQDGANVGVIAQNVQSVYPELVGSNADGLTVNYGGLVAPLIEAVKELKAEKDAEIEALQAQIEALQAQLAE